VATSPTYDFYTANGGTLEESAFNRALSHGVAAVSDVIGYNEVDDTTLEAYQKAVCAAIDVDAAYGFSGGVQEGASSMSIGAFSISAGAPSYASDMRQVITPVLRTTGLLFQGLL